ncbi:AAA family ATPase, partial [Succinimonas amylolytica]|uniref:AAA family ATPase n=1 Tax=Succinimonas amylolytica TaxID=83769 RepID=UPI0023A8984B
MPQAQSQGELTMTVSGKSFPIGETDFETIINDGKIYIDKTSYLKSLLTSAVEVFHFLRPHGFGKTLSLRMLASFLEMN